MLARANLRALARLAPAVAVSVGLLSACSVSNTVTGGNDPVTKPAVQSETSAASAVVNGKMRLSVAYNDETGQAAKIQYPDDKSRLVVTGATAMGWSWSDDGKTWTHGGPVPTPPGFSVLWGDPAMAVSGSKKNIVFMSSLAVPTSKMPANGVVNSFQTGTVTSPLGGACIAKSTDGGKGFSNWHCIQDLTAIAGVDEAVKGHFYDGGSMASTPSGEVFAAYNDVPAGQMDVWRATSENAASFTQLPDPFPGKVAVSHPRMRVGPDGVLYLAAKLLTGNGAASVFMTRLVNGGWTPAVQVGQPLAVNLAALDLGSSVQGKPLTLRLGPQFAFDVGASSNGGKDAVRLVETHSSGGRFFLQGFACAADLTSCAPVQGWKLGPSSPGAPPLDLYNPDVVAWPGDAAHPDPVWQASFMERFGSSTTTINVSRTTLGFVNGNPLVFPVNIAKQVPVCSDARGFWGDYDVMIITGPGKSGMNWMRFFTDSSNGCAKRWQFTGQEQHVSQANYDL